MQRKDDIQGLLNERFQDFEAEPEIDLWKGIEAELYPAKQRNRKLWPYFSVAASIVMLIFAWVYLNSPSEAEVIPERGFTEEQPIVPSEESLPGQEYSNPVGELEETLTDGDNTVSDEQDQRQEKNIQQQNFVPTFSKAKELIEENMPRKELVEQNLLVSKEELNKEEQQIEKNRLKVDPLEKELIAMNDSPVEEPQVSKISVDNLSDAPAELSEENTDRGLVPSDLSFNKIVSLASQGIDKLKNASPVKVYEEKNDKGESKVYELNLFKFSVSHKTQKRRNKKVRL
ncbi:MAG: hypothetical protein AAF696_12825 [Bacteroidota bacterium]